MAGVDAVALQVLHMVDAPGSSLDGGQTASTPMTQWIFLSALETVAHLCWWSARSRARSGQELANGSRCRACIRGTGTLTSQWLHGLAISGALPQARSKGAKSLTILLCWTVWCERNKRILVFDRVRRAGFGAAGSCNSRWGSPVD
jgi:hypothetical protein